MLLKNSPHKPRFSEKNCKTIRTSSRQMPMNTYKKPSYAIILHILLRIVLKGYWVKQLIIPDTDLFVEYIRTIIPWLRSVGGIVIAKDINQNSDLNQWDGGQLGVVVEFDSKESAQKAFYSKEFQEYITLRDLRRNMFLSIID